MLKTRLSFKLFKTSHSLINILNQNFLFFKFYATQISEKDTGTLSNNLPVTLIYSVTKSLLTSFKKETLKNIKKNSFKSHILPQENLSTKKDLTKWKSNGKNSKSSLKSYQVHKISLIHKITRISQRQTISESYAIWMKLKIKLKMTSTKFSKFLPVLLLNSLKKISFFGEIILFTKCMNL